MIRISLAFPMPPLSNSIQNLHFGTPCCPKGPLHSREEIPRRDQVAISTIIFLVAASATMTSAKGCHRFAIRADATASRRSSKRPVRTPLTRDLIWKRARARRKSVAVHCKMLRLPVADTLIRLGHHGVQVARNLTGDFGRFMTIYFQPTACFAVFGIELDIPASETNLSFALRKRSFVFSVT